MWQNAPFGKNFSKTTRILAKNQVLQNALLVKIQNEKIGFSKNSPKFKNIHLWLFLECDILTLEGWI